MYPAAKLSVLIEALELQSDAEPHVYYDRQTGAIVYIEDSVFVAVEEGDEERLEHVPDWQKLEIEAARAVLADENSRFIAAPDRFDFHEYRHMELFIGSVADPEMAGQLWRAIRGAGAFRHFKGTLHRLGLIDGWYQFREKAIKQFVIEWAEENSLSYIDDLRKA